MVSGKDDKFGQTAVQLGYLSDQQVSECVSIQAKMREMGIDEPLGEIFVKKGYLTVLQKQNILKKLGVQTSPIPGYTILGKIGQGGMGAVYKARQASVNRTVAIKILSQTATKDKTYIARFFQEAQAAAALDHKNLISAIDVGEAAGIYYFVMEFVTGKSCRELLNTKGPFDPKPLLDVAIQMAEVLDHIHQHQMVHRDIKPENIILTPEGVVKLCDLGLAKSTTEMEQSLTQTGLTVGTPYFMPPEQVRGDRDIDIRADLYSLGGSLYYLASGKYPYEGKSAAETMSLHLNKPVPDVRKLAPKISDDLSSVIQKLMAKDRAHRYQEPSELVEDLKKLKTGNSPQLAREHAARSHLITKAHSRSRVVVRKSNATVPILAACGAGAITLAILLFSGSSTPPGPNPALRPRIAKGTQAPTPAPVPRVSRPVPEPAVKQDDPEKAVAAARLFTSGEQLMKQEKWTEAHQAFLKLNEEFNDLKYVGEKSVTIGENIGLCEIRIREIKEGQQRLIDEARAAVDDANWKDARDHFETLVEAGRTEFRREVERCDRELEAEAFIAEVDAAAKKREWAKVRSRIRKDAGPHGLTETGRAERERLTALDRKAGEELETEQAIQHASAAGVASKWMDLERHLVTLERRRTTQTYKQNEKTILALQKKLREGNKARAEQMAEKAWQNAVRDFSKKLDERKYDEAPQPLRDFLARYTGTDAHKKYESQAKIKINSVRRRQEQDRKSDSRSLYTAANKAYTLKRFNEALTKYRELEKKYADTSVARTYGVRIAGLIRDCEDRLGIAEHVLVNHEFEDRPGQWTVRGGATAINGRSGYESEQAAKIYLPGRVSVGTTNNTRVQHPLSGVTSDAETLSFWAKTAKKGPVAQINFAIQDADGSYIVDVTINNTWKQYTFRMRDFRPYGVNAKGRANLDAIQRIMIDPNGSTDCEILIDRLRVEKKPAQRRR